MSARPLSLLWPQTGHDPSRSLFHRADNWLVDYGSDEAQSNGLSPFGQVRSGQITPTPWGPRIWESPGVSGAPRAGADEALSTWEWPHHSHIPIISQP